MTTPVNRRSVADRIAHRLRDAIVGGRLRPGDELPSERELAEKYAVNRSSVREALHRLETWGLVHIRHGGATRVAEFLEASLELLPHLVAVGGRADPSILADVHEIRGMMLGWCAEKAATMADPASISRLEELVRQMAEPRDPKELQALDYAFFQELVAITGNRPLALFGKVLREVYFGAREQYLPIYQRDVFDLRPHRKTVEAIRARDAKAASEAMREHASAALKVLEDRP